MTKIHSRAVDSRKGHRVKNRLRLNKYLAAGFTGAVLGVPTAQAQIVNINLGPSGFNILGTNGGISSGYRQTRNNFPLSSLNTLAVANQFTVEAELTGVGGYGDNLQFAVYGDFAKPFRFSAGYAISYLSGFPLNSNYITASAFKVKVGFTTYIQDNWNGNHYLGFRFSTNNGANYNYGWMKATWDKASENFELLAAAYELTPDTPIQAGVQAVPEPSSMVLAGISGLALGAGAIRRARKLRKEKASAEA